MLLCLPGEVSALCRALCSEGASIPDTREDLPEPETPVTEVIQPNGKSTLIEAFGLFLIGHGKRLILGSIRTCKRVPVLANHDARPPEGAEDGDACKRVLDLVAVGIGVGSLAEDDLPAKTAGRLVEGVSNLVLPAVHLPEREPRTDASNGNACTCSQRTCASRQRGHLEGVTHPLALIVAEFDAVDLHLVRPASWHVYATNWRTLNSQLR